MITEAASTNRQPGNVRSSWRFSLRSVFVLLTVVALFLGWLLNGVHQQRMQEAAMKRLTDHGFRFRQDAIESKNGFSARAWLQLYDERYAQEVISVSGPASVDERDWQALELFSELKQLRISGGPSPTPLSLLRSSSATGQPSIQASQSVPPRQFIKLPPEAYRTISRLSKLDSLSLRGVDISADELRALTSLPLISLDLPLTSLNDQALETLAKIPTLRYLSLPQCAISNDGLVHLKSLTQLVSLNVSRCEVTDQGLGNLKSVRRLTALDLSHCRVSDAGIAQLADLPHLISLNIAGTSVTEETIISLQRVLPRLSVTTGENDIQTTRLDLEKLQQSTALSFSGPFSSDLSLEWVSRAQQLRTLSLTNSRVTDDGLKHLKPLSKLQSLDLRHTSITGTGLKSLSDLPNLTTLYLGEEVIDDGLQGAARIQHLSYLLLQGKRVTDRGIKQLEGATQLRTVAMRTPSVGTRGFESLARLPALESLSLHEMRFPEAAAAKLALSPRLRDISLIRVQLDDSALGALAAARSLKVLYMDGVKVSRGSLQQIAAIPALESVTFHNCELTVEDARQLQRMKPQLKVSVDGPNSPVRPVN